MAGSGTLALHEPVADEALAALVRRIDEKYRPVWEGRPAREALALARYFLPRRSQLPRLAPTRPRVVKWYCPFAAQAVFPSGHRTCINVYVGCAHRCVYCYATYEPEAENPKRAFRRLLDRDLADLEELDVPAAPVHLSNSTDPFQPLEERQRDTQYALERLLAYRHRFTTITVLTKNPSLAARPPTLDLLRALGPACRIEVSLSFWRDSARAFYDPGAPTVADRMAGLRALAGAGVRVVLRIDPLFPRSPLPGLRGGLADYGLPEAQTLEDLERLVALAREVGAMHVVWSVAKLAQPRCRPMHPAIAGLRRVYQAMSAPHSPIWRGGSWRLPPAVAAANVADPFLALCRAAGVAAKFCRKNLIETL